MDNISIGSNANTNAITSRTGINAGTSMIMNTSINSNAGCSH